MIPLPLREVAAITGGVLHSPTGDDVSGVVVDGPVVTDSREAGPGSLYVARVGERADGHRFAGSARDRGAVAALTTRPLRGPALRRRPRRPGRRSPRSPGPCVDRSPDLTVIGVTGSSGKTSTKDLLASVLARHGETVANTGSLNSEVGVPLTVAPDHADHPVPGRRDGRPRRRAHRLPHPDRSARGRRRAQRRHRPRRRVRLARGDRRGQVRAGPGAARHRCRGPQRRRPGGGRHAQPHRRPRRGRGRDRRPPTCAPPTSGWTRPGRPSFTLAGGGRRGRRSGSVCTGSTTSATPSRSRPSRSTVGMTAGRRSPRRWRRPVRPAAGGWRSTSAPTA